MQTAAFDTESCRFFFQTLERLCVKPRVFENIVKGFVRLITFLVFFSIVLLAFLFAANNTTVVVLWLGIEMPAASVGVLIIISFVVGGFLGLLLGVGIFKKLKTMVHIKKLRSEVARLEKLHPAKKTTT